MKPAGTLRIDDVREMMLSSIDTMEAGSSTRVAHRIRHAVDWEALWFLRGDLMLLLASSHGEYAALEKLDAISSVFEHLLPEGLRSRPSLLKSSPRH